MPKHVKRWCGLLGASTVLGLAIYDGYHCVKRLRKPLNTKFMTRRCEYIYLPHDYFREPVKDFLNKLFQEETMIYSALYNLKKRLTFTKVGHRIYSRRNLLTPCRISLCFSSNTQSKLFVWRNTRRAHFNDARPSKICQVSDSIWRSGSGCS